MTLGWNDVTVVCAFGEVSVFAAGYLHRDAQVLAVAGSDALRRPLLNGNGWHHGRNRQRHGAVLHLECRLQKKPAIPCATF